MVLDMGVSVERMETTEIRPLPTQFKRNGFTHTQVAVAHPVYVYEKRKGRYTGFEVIKARPRPERVFKDRRLEAAWAYPASEDWGTYGFTCPTLLRAMEKAGELA